MAKVTALVASYDIDPEGRNCMLSKIETRFYSLIQSIRFANSETKMNSINEFITKSLNDNSEYGDDELRFSVYSDYHNELSSLPGEGFRDIEVNDSILIENNTIFNEVKGKWVITSGEFEGKGFDLSDVTFGKSNMYFGSVMNQITRLLNKSTRMEVWVNGDKRGKLKGFNNEVRFLVLHCKVPKANPYKGLALIHLIIVNFDKSNLSSVSKGSCSIEFDERFLKLELAKAIFNGDKSLDDWNKVNNKHHERLAPSHDGPEL